MDIKITVTYEIKDFIDEDELIECYNNSIEEALKDIIEIESLLGLVDFDTENIIKIEKIKND